MTLLRISNYQISKLERDGLNNLHHMQLNMNDDDEEFSLPESGLEMGGVDSETHDDVDPFEELGIGGNTTANRITYGDDDGLDAFSDLMDDEELQIEESDEGAMNKDEEIYVMLLKTVWVDGILDPAEVRLLAKKRVELNITFERHLELVQNLIG